jgi:hypothetical protein
MNNVTRLTRLPVPTILGMNPTTGVLGTISSLTIPVFAVLYKYDD